MRLRYIDGLKAVGCFFVYFCHFNGLLHLVKLPEPIAFLDNGEFAVALFLMLSGFSIAMSLNRDDSNEKVRKMILGRYFRFAIPMAVISTFAYIIYLFGGFRVSEVAGIIGQSYGAHEYTNIGFRHYLAMLLLAPMSYTALNNPLWMMKYIFEGTFVIVILHIGVGKIGIIKKTSILLFALLLSVMESIYLSDVIFGMLIYELWSSGKMIFIPSSIRRILAIILLFVAYYIAVFFHRDSVSGASAITLLLLLLGAASLTFSVLMTGILQKIFSIGPMKFMGGISFELYLIHWMIVCSFSSWMWLKCYSLGGGYVIWYNFIVTTIVVLALSYIMKKFIEPLICKPFENWIMTLLLK